MAHSLISVDANPGEHSDQCYRCGTAWDYPENLATGVTVPAFISYYPCNPGDGFPCDAPGSVGAHHFMATGPDSAECHYCGETYGGDA